ncbi:MAG: polyamine aminopropyltransferase [Methylophilus sp.]|nr:polyamine aminopropyltransferase [Methylophilus sp.]
MFGFGKKIHRSVASESVEVGEVDGVRSMYIGSSTIQSSMRVKAPYDLELTYSKGMMLFLLFAPQVRDVLMLGLGGGSIPKYIHHYHPHIKTRVIELSPQVISIARSHFYLPDDDARLQVIEGDGVQYIRDHPETTDLLMLDMFDGKGVPLNMYSQDFFDSCRAALTTNGVLEINLWGSDKNFDVYLQRIEQSFNDRVLMIPTGRPGNIVVMGFNRLPNELRWEPLRQKAKALDAELKLDFMGLLERLRDHNNHTPSRIIME